MNMFQADLAFAVELIAVGIGVAFIIWSYRSEGAGIIAAKITGYFILILAGAALLCTSYYTMKYWEEGYFKSSHHIQRMQHRMMMRKIHKMHGQENQHTNKMMPVPQKSNGKHLDMRN